MLPMGRGDGGRGGRRGRMLRRGQRRSFATPCFLILVLIFVLIGLTAPLRLPLPDAAVWSCRLLWR